MNTRQPPRTPATRVVNLRHEPYDIYIGRARASGPGGNGEFGNPFKLKRDTDFARAEVIDIYRRWFLERVERDPHFRAAVLALHGKVLGCFCKPKACHGDVIAEWVDAHATEAEEAALEEAHQRAQERKGEDSPWDEP